MPEETSTPVEKTTKKASKDNPLTSYQASPHETALRRSYGLPTCKKCGSGFRTDLDGNVFCPAGDENCPMMALEI